MDPNIYIPKPNTLADLPSTWVVTDVELDVSQDARSRKGEVFAVKAARWWFQSENEANAFAKSNPKLQVREIKQDRGHHHFQASNGVTK